MERKVSESAGLAALNLAALTKSWIDQELLGDLDDRAVRAANMRARAALGANGMTP